MTKNCPISTIFPQHVADDVLLRISIGENMQVFTMAKRLSTDVATLSDCVFSGAAGLATGMLSGARHFGHEVDTIHQVLLLISNQPLVVVPVDLRER